MMKSRDLSTAVSLALQGFLRSNDDGDGDKALFVALAAIRQEADDWSENLAAPADVRQAIEPTSMTVECFELTGPVGDKPRVGACIARSPYNLVSGALRLLHEAVDVGGLAMVAADLKDRAGLVPFTAPRPLGEILGATEVVGSEPSAKVARSGPLFG